MGGLPHPELSDWQPKGQVSQAYDLWNDERGTTRRGVIIVDKAGVIRFRQTYEPGTLPDTAQILQIVEGLN